MNRNVTKTVTHHILPCLGLLIVEAVSCVLAVYGIVILLGYDAPSLYCVLSGILKAVALVILLLISVGRFYWVPCPLKQWLACQTTKYSKLWLTASSSFQSPPPIKTA